MNTKIAMNVPFDCSSMEYVLLALVNPAPVNVKVVTDLANKGSTDPTMILPGTVEALLKHLLFKPLLFPLLPHNIGQDCIFNKVRRWGRKLVKS